MTFDDEIILLKQKININKYNQERIIYEESKILASKESVSMKEFYNAKNDNMQVDITFIIHSFEYEGQEFILFKDKKYKIIRSYMRKDNHLELICEEVKLIE